MSSPSSFTMLAPIIPRDTALAAMRVLRHESPQLLQEWKASVAARGDLRPAEREAMQRLFAYLTNHMSDILAEDPNVAETFALFVLSSQPALRATHVLFALSCFEERILSVLGSHLGQLDASVAARWLRAVTWQLTNTAVESSYLAAPDRSAKNGPNMRLSHWLNAFCMAPMWKWVALCTTKPDIRILQFAVYEQDAKGSVWHDVPAPDSFRQLRQVGLHLDETGQYPLPANLCLVTPKCESPFGHTLLERMSQCLAYGLTLSDSREPFTQSEADVAWLEKLLRYDESLLSANDCSALFESLVVHVCELCGFKRSSLFLYSPFTHTVEGIYGHNVRIQDILRIRETERNIPVLTHVLGHTYPVYYPDVKGALPDHYVDYFHLTSLLVCPVRDASGHPVGVLLLDQVGKPFHASDQTILQVHEVVSRISFCLTAQSKGDSRFPSAQVPQLLSTREREILQLISDGLDTKEVAKQLHISEHTVSEHVASILRKYNAKNRTQAVAHAIRQGTIH